jgi:hypothetical protein
LERKRDAGTGQKECLHKGRNCFPLAVAPAVFAIRWLFGVAHAHKSDERGSGIDQSIDGRG